MVGLGERILKTSLPERHLCHSWAHLPISPQHLPSPLSYKSQWPLLFQSPLREARGEGFCWQTWILALMQAVFRHLTKGVSGGFGKELHSPERVSLYIYSFGKYSVICKCLDSSTCFLLPWHWTPLKQWHRNSNLRRFASRWEGTALNSSSVVYCEKVCVKKDTSPFSP